MSNELICIVSLSVLCIFWSYRFLEIRKTCIHSIKQDLGFSARCNKCD